eukprot:GFUD01044077.1.p1 GENE.GFUD01044077.1~~GFUD01044077.1.p1  ORF type:complete len:477 (-),score=81.09 GFUD01044077.1:335-1765(-)
MGAVKKKLMSKVKNEGRKTKKELAEQIKSSNFWSVAFRTMALISFYYATSIGLTFYQSWLLKKLQFPLTIVLCHFIMKFVASWGCRMVYSLYTGVERVTLGWSHMLGRIGVVALVASLDIGLSQWSFEYIDVALYTITKSTSIVFILMFAILFRLEKKHWSLIIIVLMISTGLAMFTYKSTDFVLIGFTMVLSASFLSGIRWTLSQLIMQKAQFGLSNPIDMIYHVQPVMIFCLLPFAVGFEGTRISSSIAVFRFQETSVFFHTLSLIAFGGLIAFGMEAGEYLLVSYTSGLTLSVAGIVKEIISLTLAIIYQSSDISVINMIGLVVCMLGITLHVVRKATQVEKPEKNGTGRFLRREGASNTTLPLLSDSDTDSETEIYHTTRQGASSSKSKPITEDIFMKDHRQWTGVRDSHIEHLYKDNFSLNTNKSNDYSFTSLNNENCAVTDDIIDVGNDSNDAILEAEQLLDQLDLLSSD